MIFLWLRFEILLFQYIYWYETIWLVHGDVSKGSHNEWWKKFWDERNSALYIVIAKALFIGSFYHLGAKETLHWGRVELALWSSVCHFFWEGLKDHWHLNSSISSGLLVMSKILVVMTLKWFAGAKWPWLRIQEVYLIIL